MGADFAEAAGGEQPPARLVAGEDLRGELVEAAQPGSLGEALQQGPPDPAAADVAIDVDGRLPDPLVVVAAVLVGAGLREADDLAVALVDEADLPMRDRVGDRRRVLQAGLERRDSVLDPLVVDLGDRLGVRGARGPDLAL
jgi:hypothetical protein